MDDHLHEDAVLRAGFWRRVGASVIDGLVVLVPLQIVVAILFTLTGGAVQGSFGLISRTCEGLTALPPGVEAHIDGYNQITDCRTSLFGFDPSRSLIVARVEQSGSSTNTVFESFNLGSDGQLIEGGFDAGWLAEAVLLGYVIWFEAVRGATLGKQAVGVRVVPRGRPDVVGVGFRAATIRSLVLLVGNAPLLLVNLYAASQAQDPTSTVALVTSPGFLFLSTVSAVIALGWMLWIAISIIRKVDAIHDRMAGTSVIRVPAQSVTT